MQRVICDKPDLFRLELRLPHLLSLCDREVSTRQAPDVPKGDRRDGAAGSPALRQLRGKQARDMQNVKRVHLLAHLELSYRSKLL
jgi:hypothetical protein